MSREEKQVLVGIISDTHGTLTQAACDALEGCERIIHAGDIGSPNVLYRLESIAPVTAVLGNCDYIDYGPSVASVATPVFSGVRFKVVHRLRDIGPIPPDTKVIVSGHTHKASLKEAGGILYVNPGSATEPRGSRMPTVALVTVSFGRVADSQIIEFSRSVWPAG